MGLTERGLPHHLLDPAVPGTSRSAECGPAARPRSTCPPSRRRRTAAPSISSIAVGNTTLGTVPTAPRASRARAAARPCGRAPGRVVGVEEHRSGRVAHVLLLLGSRVSVPAHAVMDQQPALRRPGSAAGRRRSSAPRTRTRSSRRAGGRAGGPGCGCRPRPPPTGTYEIQMPGRSSVDAGREERPLRRARTSRCPTSAGAGSRSDLTVRPDRLREQHARPCSGTG